MKIILSFYLIESSFYLMCSQITFAKFAPNTSKAVLVILNSIIEKAKLKNFVLLKLVCWQYSEHIHSTTLSKCYLLEYYFV